MEYVYLLYEKSDGVAVITLNRPNKLNALSPELFAEIDAALAEAEEDDEVRAIILTGAGRAFSTGSAMGASDAEAPLPPAAVPRGRWAREHPSTFEPYARLEEWLSWNRDRYRGWFNMRDLTKPIIAAVNGYCLGAALELALWCDMVIAAADAEFGQPEIRHGSIMASVLPWHVGMQKAKEIILTGDTIDATEAHRIGLVIRVVPRDKLLDEAMRLARRIARVPRHAVMLNKLQIDTAMEDMGIRNGMAHAHLVDTMCHYLMREPGTESARLFDLMPRGLKAFLDARDRPFPEEERPFRGQAEEK